MYNIYTLKKGDKMNVILLTLALIFISGVTGCAGKDKKVNTYSKKVSVIKYNRATLSSDVIYIEK